MVLHAHRSRAEAEQLAAEIVGGGRARQRVLADLADPDAVRGLDSGRGGVRAADAAGQQCQPNSSRTRSRSLERARFERTLAVNLTAPLFLAQAFAAQAPAGADASIVNIVDQRVLKPTPRFFSYTLSKSALHSATATLAQALAPKLRVNAVAPGPTLPSPRQTRRSNSPRRRRPCRSSAGRRPEDIAAAVLYLAQAKRHRRDHRGRRRPASGLAHRRQRRRGVA